MNRETLLQKQIRLALSNYGICIRLNTGFFLTADNRTVKCGIPGMPDLLWLGPAGKTVWLECKVDKGKLSEKQERFIARIKDMGHNVGVVRSVDEAMKLIGVKNDG